MKEEEYKRQISSIISSNSVLYWVVVMLSYYWKLFVFQWTTIVYDVIVKVWNEKYWGIEF